MIMGRLRISLFRNFFVIFLYFDDLHFSREACVFVTFKAMGTSEKHSNFTSCLHGQFWQTMLSTWSRQISCIFSFDITYCTLCLERGSKWHWWHAFKYHKKITNENWLSVIEKWNYFAVIFCYLDSFPYSSSSLIWHIVLLLKAKSQTCTVQCTVGHSFQHLSAS